MPPESAGNKKGRLGRPSESLGKGKKPGQKSARLELELIDGCSPAWHRHASGCRRHDKLCSMGTSDSYDRSRC